MNKAKRKNKVKQHIKFSENSTSEIIENGYNDDYETPKKWYDEVVNDKSALEKVSDQIIIELKDEAKICHDAEVANFNIKNSKTNTDYQWMKTVMSKGTISDKIAAHTVAIQDNPICNLDTLKNLVSMVKVGKKKECLAVIETLTELFLSDLLRPGAKLKLFEQHPLTKLNDLSSGNAVTRRKLLSAWYFEDQLKELYKNFVSALNNISHDTLDSNKEKAIGAMYKLLEGNPEQEQLLLTYIVNKLGDPSQKVASKAIYCLSQLLFKHSNMQKVVLREVEKLLFRSNVSSKTQYYGLCFLSQFYLNHESSDVAQNLITVYFSFFKACIKKGEVDSRMMCALLMGVKRAYPYAKIHMNSISEHVENIYRVVHIANFNVSLHALNLLYQVSDLDNNITDRFYSALYKKLVDSKLATTTHQAMLLSLIYKAILKDKETSRIKAFIKRLLQISLQMQPSFTCGMLFLISQVMTKRNELDCFISKQTTLNGLEDYEDDEEKYVDIKEPNVEAIEVNDDESVEEEDVKQDLEEIKPKEEEGEENKPDVEILNSTMPATSWYHINNAIKKEKSHAAISQYRPFSRNPLYAGGDFCTYTELINFKDHFHPTVSLYAMNILKGEPIKYSGDPLKDFTLVRFLDRFVFKNPKKLEDLQGAHPTFGRRKLYKPKGARSLPVKSAAYINETQQNIPVDELFMQAYLQKKYKDKQYKEEEDDSDLESVQSEEFEEMLDKMAGVGNDLEDEDLDYMNDIGEKLKKKDKKKKSQAENDDAESNEDDDYDDEEEEEDGLSDEEDDLEMDEDDFNDLSDDDDEDNVFDEDEEYDEAGEESVDSDEENLNSKLGAKKNKNSKKKAKGVDSLFASADEFAALLEDEGSSKVAPGGGNVFANKDNANTKQLAWEDNRNRWLNNYKKEMGGKGKKFNNKRQKSFQKNSGNKKKKFKK